MASSIQPGAIIDGKYRVGRRIGEGGMGTVYEGENIRIERRVAIKVLHEHVAASPEFAQRFEREARASGRIGSPHVCDVLDLGDLESGDRYIVMEFLEGENLEDRLTKGKLTARELAPIAFEILEGLGTMHQAGVIHRDLKPANIFLARGRGARAETVKILDFGVAKIAGRADEAGAVTTTGMMMGTPLYMSPEQARGARDVDGRTDLYAASVIFYRALTGEMPHAGLNLHELLFKIVLEDPRPILELSPEVDEVFAAIVTKGLARDPDLRHATARDYQVELASWGQGQGRDSLKFAVVLSSDPPPLRSITGGFPASVIAASALKSQTPTTGPSPRFDNVGPPTPAVAKTQAETAVLPAVAKQSDGTPLVWSEDAPEIAREALEEHRSKKTKTWRSPEMAPSPDAAGAAPEKEAVVAPSSSVPRRPQPLTRIAIGAGALIVIGAAVLAGSRLGASSPPGTMNGSPSASSLSPVLEATATATASDTPTATATPTPTPIDPATPPPTPARTATPPKASAPKAAPAPAPASASATTPPSPSPSPPTSARKFRTNLE